MQKKEQPKLGLAEGLKRGVRKNAIANAKNFLKEGDSPEKIARCCSLSLAQVFALKEELERETAVVKQARSYN